MSEQEIHFIKQPNYSRIRQDKVVRLKYAVFDLDGNHAMEYRDDLYYLHGGYGGAFPKIEAALEGLSVGAKAEVELTASEAYGKPDPQLVITESADQFPPEALEIGTRLDGEAPDGSVVHFQVTRVENGQVTVDGNHPLAGKDLRFVLEVMDIRDASDEELRAGYAFSAETPGDPGRH